MVGIRETVRRMVNEWWNRSSAEQRYTKPCSVAACDVLREAGVSSHGRPYRASMQAAQLIRERVHMLQQHSVQDANDLE